MNSKKYRCEIRRPDKTGDTLMATYDPDIPSTVAVGNRAVEDFVTQCLAGTVFATPAGCGTEDPVSMESILGALDLSDSYNPKADVSVCDSVLLMNPLSGG